MARTYYFDPKGVEYLEKNWLIKSDSEISIHTGIKLCSIERIRRKMGFFRPKMVKLNRPYVADVLNMYANGAMIPEIAMKHNRASSTIAFILTKYWFKKMQSEYTVVLVLPSKMNN